MTRWLTATAPSAVISEFPPPSAATPPGPRIGSCPGYAISVVVPTSRDPQVASEPAKPGIARSITRPLQRGSSRGVPNASCDRAYEGCM